MTYKIKTSFSTQKLEFLYKNDRSLTYNYEIKCLNKNKYHNNMIL